MNTLHHFTLNTTQEILANVTHETDAYYTIDNPLWVRIIPVDQTNYDVALDYVSYTIPTGARRLYKHAIVMETTDIPRTLESMYVKQTSGIELITPAGIAL